MKNSINFNGQRSEIILPWKGNSYLENNCFSALSQVKSLNRRLERNPQLRDNHKKTLQIDLEKTTVNKMRCKIDNFRRVANAASKFSGQSLNNNLLTGLDLLNSLLGVLMRFRENQISVLADIEGMFMQIAISQTD